MQSRLGQLKQLLALNRRGKNLRKPNLTRTMPSLHLIPTIVLLINKYHGFNNKILKKRTSEAKQNWKSEAVKPNPLLSTAFVAYSTWKTRPSGEKVVTDKS